MAKAIIAAGVCGFTTTVDARMDGGECVLAIESECGGIRRLGAELTRADPFREITFRGEGPLTLKLAAQHCKHPACPVPAGIIKAIEVAAGLALPRNASIQVAAEE